MKTLNVDKRARHTAADKSKGDKNKYLERNLTFSVFFAPHWIYLPVDVFADSSTSGSLELKISPQHVSINFAWERNR